MSVQFKQSQPNSSRKIRGAPISQSYSDEIRADAYAPDAASAVDLVEKLLKINFM